ncbi:MAG: segregation/condensation protein A [Thiofilum sp.]|uniref:segregation and condensation protein A n=1 Tax=Thiofilum sp. TaxID=2212733 RepID=UPI00260088B9|nr:segregation/condensation protein A [Thiofilum sp.]MBK8455127.1 segregation/condensation protein A [Thiofilum sp.]
MRELNDEASIPLALVYGEPLTTLPNDLYIPPDALAVVLEAFEGPLDLLLYLIRRQNLAISDIPIAAITEQYMAYVELMKEFNLDLAAEYLVMAALLAEIKSRALLPIEPTALDDEYDPRMELIKRLKEYERFKKAAHALEELPRLERDHFEAHTWVEKTAQVLPLPDIELRELVLACQAVMKRADIAAHHSIRREPLSIRERMTRVLSALQANPSVPFAELFTLEEGRRGVVVTLMAVLELLKAHLIEVLPQPTPYAPVMITAVEAV